MKEMDKKEREKITMDKKEREKIRRDIEMEAYKAYCMAIKEEEIETRGRERKRFQTEKNIKKKAQEVYNAIAETAAAIGEVTKGAVEKTDNETETLYEVQKAAEETIIAAIRVAAAARKGILDARQREIKRENKKQKRIGAHEKWEN